MHLARVAIVLVAISACGGMSEPSVGAPASSRGVAPSAIAATTASPSSATPETTPPQSEDSRFGPTATSSATTAVAAGLPADSKCHESSYRCVVLPAALDWWGSKPALLPATDRARQRALLHAARDPDVKASTDADYAPDFSYVVPDTLFATMTQRRGGVSSAARQGGIVVRNYFATKRWLPTPAKWSKRVVVRGHDAILTEFKTTDGSPPARDVSWWVPYGDGTYVVWYVADSPEKRSESELLAFLEALVPA